MPFEFDGEQYAKNSVLQRNIGIPIIDELELRGDECILDIGCGDGALSAKLAELTPNGHVTGLDASTGMIDVAQTHEASNLSFILGDVTHLDDVDTYDIVFSNAALHWIINHEDLLSRVHRCLKPGGYLRWNFAADGNCPNFIWVAYHLMNEPVYQSMFSDFEWPWCMPTKDEYTALLESADYDDIRVWTEPVERRFPDTESLISWMDQPSLVPFMTHLPEDVGADFRKLFIKRLIAATQQSDGACREQFMRLNVFARK